MPVQGLMSPNLPMQARQQGFGYMPPMQSPQQPQQAPAGLLAGPQGVNRMNQIFGLLAGSAEDPTSVGLQYVNALQNQQRMQAENSETARLHRLIGPITPTHWTSESMQRFFDDARETGFPNYGLLERHKGLSSVLEKEMLAAYKTAMAAGDSATVAGDLADRYLDAFKRGNFRQGLAGTVDDWIVNNITGAYEDRNALIRDFNKYRNREVIQGLPPGVASDRDISIAMQGYPKATSDPAYMAAYLTGIKKLKIIEHARAIHQSDYIGRNRDVTGAMADWNKRGMQYVQQSLGYYGLSIDQSDKSLSPAEYASKRYGSRVRALPGTSSGIPSVTAPPGEQTNVIPRPEVTAEDINYWSNL